MSRSLRILILEDEAGIRSALSKVLPLHGHRAFGTASPEEALEIARREPIDVVLTDLRLEEGDGVEAFERIRAIRPEARLILMTGYGSLESALRALRLGAADYLTKPFRIETLVQTLRKIGGTGETPRKALRLPWESESRSDSESASQLLYEIDCLLRAIHVEADARRRILSAFGEAVANACRHAYPDGPGALSVSLQEQEGFLIGRISDRGKGFEGPSVVARSLTSAEDSPNGISFLHRQVDDLRIRSAKGQGCSVEFRVRACAASPEGLRLPSIPVGERWERALWEIENSPVDLHLDFSEIEYLSPSAATELRQAIRELQQKGHRVQVQNMSLPPISASLLAAEIGGRKPRNKTTDDDLLLRQALWA